MNLFWKKTFGGLTPTAKFEAEHKTLIAEFKRYNAVHASKELAEYAELYEQVKSADFKENKRMLKSRKYKDTEEYRDMKKMRKLDGNAALQMYFRVCDSKELREYQDFEKNADFVLLGDPKEVKKSPELTRLKKFEKSKEYKTYVRFHDSYMLKEYLELKEKVSTPEFKKSNEFWADAKRWDNTKEAALENRYFTLAENDDIKFYLSQKDDKFANIKAYELAFKEGFDGNILPTTSWEYGFCYDNDALVGKHSFLNEKQANTCGNNVAVVNGRLNIITKEGKTDAIVWHPERGFVQHTFDYSSDVINGHKVACQRRGVFSAKLRFTGSGDVSHAFWLTDGTKTPHINVCRCNGKEIEVGIYWNSKFEKKYTSTKITGLNPREFYIYSVEIKDNDVIWYINNLEVFRCSNYIPEKPMFPVFNSFIPENKKGGAAVYEIDNVNTYLPVVEKK
ncbi:MAG: glycoside hydrolase family 16 protein [bacterium]